MSVSVDFNMKDVLADLNDDTAAERKQGADLMMLEVVDAASCKFMQRFR